MVVRRWLVPLAIAIVVLGLVGGLWLIRGSGGSSTANGPAGSPSTGPSGMPISPEPSASPVSPAPHQSGFPNPRAVTILGYTSHGTTLTVQYAIGAACSGRLDRPQVDQTADAVTVTLRAVPPRKFQNRMCPQFAMLKTAKLALDAPLGSRPVIDGSTGKPVPEGITGMFVAN